MNAACQPTRSPKNRRTELQARLERGIVQCFITYFTRKFGKPRVLDVVRAY